MNVDLDELQRQGFVLLTGLFSQKDTDSFKRSVQDLFEINRDDNDRDDKVDSSIRSQGGVVYAARNLHEIYPDFHSIWMRPAVCRLVEQILGPAFGLVRALYFDKHPERTWSLPWHRDMTIAVKDNSLFSNEFTKPTFKAGIPHVEAPLWLLQKMITLRLHLDSVNKENGPLIVRTGDFCEKEKVHRPHHDFAVECEAGDMLAMRPLLLHSSPSSSQGTSSHRRIIHMEFCHQERLPDGFRWRTFQKPVFD